MVVTWNPVVVQMKAKSRGILETQTKGKFHMYSFDLH
jgi:hypothetical protein